MLSTKAALVTIILGLGLLLSVAHSSSDGQLGSTPAPSYNRPILPELYLIRPGEKFTVTFLGTQLSSLSLEVDAESRIVDSDLGVIDLSGKSLSQTRQIIEEVLQQVYSVDNIAISVGRPVPVSVTVGGAVSSPGRYTAYSSQTVSEIIDSAGGVLPEGSTRRILLSGGERSLVVDLDRARYLNDPQADPHLYAGFDIFVPLKSSNVVEVVGAVSKPRQIEVMEGESVATVLGLAGEAMPGAALEKIYLLNHPEQPLPPTGTIRPGDVVVVPFQAGDAEAEKITLVGAVQRQGSYPFSAGMSLSDLIDQAGGFRKDANPHRIAIFRLGERDAWGRSPNLRYSLILNLETVDPGTVLIHPSDSVFVPVKVGYVRLSGSVPRPGLYPFSDSRTVDYYLGLAGLSSSNRQETSVSVADRATSLTIEVGPEYRVADGDEIILTRNEAEK